MDQTNRHVIIRPAESSDIPAVTKLGARVFTATFGHTVEPHQLQAYLDKDYTEDAIAAALADPNQSMIVAESRDNHDVNGFAVLMRNSTEPCIADLPNTVELLRLYVDNSCHGKGIGTTLARQIESLAKKQGFEHIWLGVWEENAIAQKLYTKLGYKTVGVHDFVVGDIVQQDEIMVKALQ